jgi:hypothetical protein
LKLRDPTHPKPYVNSGRRFRTAYTASANLLPDPTVDTVGWWALEGSNL